MAGPKGCTHRLEKNSRAVGDAERDKRSEKCGHDNQPCAWRINSGIRSNSHKQFSGSGNSIVHGTSVAKAYCARAFVPSEFGGKYHGDFGALEDVMRDK